MLRKMHKRKAYTLLEVIIVSVITSILFILGARWIYALTSAANAPLLGRDATEISYSLDKLENDLRLSQSCDSFNQTSVLHELSVNTLSFTLDADSDGDADKVSWRLHEGDLQRALVMGSNCNYAAPSESSWNTLAQGVEGNPELFSVLQGGQLLPLTASLDCLNSVCAFDGIDIDIASSSSNASTTRTLLLDN